MFLPTPYLKRHEVYDFEIFVRTLMGDVLLIGLGKTGWDARGILIDKALGDYKRGSDFLVMHFESHAGSCLSSLGCAIAWNNDVVGSVRGAMVQAWGAGPALGIWSLKWLWSLNGPIVTLCM